MVRKPVSITNAPWLWLFDTEINRAHPWLTRSKFVKFHDHRWITESIMVLKPFSIPDARWPWHFDPKINRAHPWLVGSKCMKFHYNFSKGISLTVRKPIVDARPRHIRLRAEYCNWAKNFKKQLCRQGTLTPPDTWSCPTLGLACVLMSRPFSPELVLSPDLWISNTPRYFSFAYQYKGKQRSVMITQEMCPWIRAEI